LRALVRDCLDTDLKTRIASFEEVTGRLRALLPALEASSLRLPTPLIATSVVDPDATNALPVLRASDRPPALGSFRPPPMPGSIPPPSHGLSGSGSVPPGSISSFPAAGATGPSWHTPNTSYASITVSAPRPRHTAWIALGAAALLVIALGAGVGLGWRSRGAGNAASSGRAEPARAQALALAPTPPPPASDEPASVSVDSLPGAASSGGTKLGPVPRGAGRLFVTATPGWCQLAVDGKIMGPTPVAGIDLSAGAHQLRCEAPGGKVKATSIMIQDGATARTKLAFDE
jgi:hypothetical protein